MLEFPKQRNISNRIIIIFLIKTKDIYFLKERILTFILQVFVSEAAEAVVKYVRGYTDEAVIQSATYFAVFMKLRTKLCIPEEPLNVVFLFIIIVIIE